MATTLTRRTRRRSLRPATPPLVPAVTSPTGSAGTTHNTLTEATFMNDAVTATTDPAPGARSYTVTARITVRSQAELRDPFMRFAVFQALVDHLRTGPLTVDTPHGPATAEIGLVTGVA